MTHLSRFLSISLLCTVLVNAALAESGEKPEPPWYEQISINVFAEAGIETNFNKPASSLNQLRIFDRDVNSFGIDAFGLTIRKKAIKPGDAGFHMDLMAGTALPKVIRATGMNTGDIDFRQLYLSYIVPVGRGLRVDAGKIASPHGYEGIDTWDGINDNATRSFLFGYAVPFTHTGIRFKYEPSDNMQFAAMVTNGWDNAIDSNDAKTIHVQAMWSPAPTLALSISAARGAEQPHNNSNQRSLVDFYASWAPLENLTLGVCIDMGSEDGIGAAGAAASWKGIAGYGRITISDKFAICPRAEVFNDVDGVRTGAMQTLRSFTITPEYKPSAHFVLRGDLRIDQSTAAVFQKGSEMTTSQPTVSLNAVVVY